jgi:hypothetical protein
MIAPPSYLQDLGRFKQHDPNIVAFSREPEDELVGGRPSGRKAIRVYVKRKIPLDQLSPERRLPEAIDGIPVDVVAPDKRRQRKLHAELQEFARQLERTCKTCKSVADLVDHIAKLETFVADHAPDLPPDVETNIRSGIEHVRAATSDVSDRCDSLLKTVKGAIRVLPGGLSVGTALVAATIVVVAGVGAVAANHLLGPSITVVNASCADLPVPGWAAPFGSVPVKTHLASGDQIELHAPWLSLDVDRVSRVVTVRGPGGITLDTLPAVPGSMRVTVDGKNLLGLTSVALSGGQRITLSCVSAGAP